MHDILWLRTSFSSDFSHVSLWKCMEWDAILYTRVCLRVLNGDNGVKSIEFVALPMDGNQTQYGCYRVRG